MVYNVCCGCLSEAFVDSKLISIDNNDRYAAK